MMTPEARPALRTRAAARRSIASGHAASSELAGPDCALLFARGPSCQLHFSPLSARSQAERLALVSGLSPDRRRQYVEIARVVGRVG